MLKGKSFLLHYTLIYSERQKIILGKVSLAEAWLVDEVPLVGLVDVAALAQQTCGRLAAGSLSHLPTAAHPLSQI